MSKTRLVVLFGAKEVGKTALVNNRMKGKFKDEYTPTDTILIKAPHEAPGALVSFFDLPGYDDLSEVENRLTASVMNDGGLLVFSVNNRKRFEELPIVLAEFRQSVKGPIFLVGTKADLFGVDRMVSFDEANEFAKENHISYFETSVKANLGVDILFSELVEAMNQYVPPQQKVAVSEEKEISFGSDDTDSDAENVNAAEVEMLLPIPALPTTPEVAVAAVEANVILAEAEVLPSPATAAKREEVERLVSNRDLRSNPSVVARLEKIRGLDGQTHFKFTNGSHTDPASEPAGVAKPEDVPAPVEVTVDPLLKALIADIHERLSKVGNSRKAMVNTLLNKCEAAQKMDEAITALKTCGADAQIDHETKSGSKWFFGKGPLFFKSSATKRQTDALIEKYNPEVRM